MIHPVWVTVVVVLCSVTTGIYAQYGSSSSPSSMSYSSAPSPSYAASPAMQSSSSSNYPAVNLPLLSYPALQGNATVGTGSSSSSSSSTSTGTGSTGTVSGTNYLASLPSSPVTNLAPYQYLYGTYADNYDASRDSYYNKSQLYAFNQYTTNLTGYGALNLSNPVAVAAANWWSPYPYALAAWNDGYTTQGSVISTTAAGSSLGGGTILNASTYYAAYGGNLAGLGIPGLGLSVPGPAPNVSIITPGLNYAYNVGGSATPAPSSGSGSGYSSSSSGYSAPAPAASSSSYGGGSSSGYGRR